MMSKITREEKMEKILEFWLDGWQDERNDISILTDELMALHTENIPLYQYDDEQLNQEYEDVIATLKDIGYKE
jgi:hypothetical protein